MFLTSKLGSLAFILFSLSLPFSRHSRHRFRPLINYNIKNIITSFHKSYYSLHYLLEHCLPDRNLCSFFHLYSKVESPLVYHFPILNNSLKSLFWGCGDGVDRRCLLGKDEDLSSESQNLYIKKNLYLKFQCWRGRDIRITEALELAEYPV